MEIHIETRAEKTFFMQLFNNGSYSYVRTSIFIDEWSSSQFRRPRVPLPERIEQVYPAFATAYRKFLTTGRWPSIIVKWNIVTPLPLPG